MNVKACAVPIIDLAGNGSTAVGEIRAAARDIGMFRVTNTGIPAPLVAAHFAIARQFFDLDAGEKSAIDVARSNCFRGYMAFGSQTIDPASPGDLKEGFIMGPDTPPDHPHVLACFPNTGTNLWPLRPADLRAQMQAYVEAMNGLGRRIAGLLALSLALPEDYFSGVLSEPLTYSQLLRYPSQPFDASGTGLGAGAHVDWGMMTLLLEDEVGGLEIEPAGRGWQRVAPVANSFVIILGEMMLRLTGGLYRSAKHRVRSNTSGRDRYAMPTFFDPGYDARIACVPTCLPLGGVARYPACTVAEHMQEMARATLSGL